MEDRILVLKCKQGSRSALARIYEKYKANLLLLALALLNDRATAEDVVHDVFVAFVESLKGFRLTGSLKAYLMTCTANKARDALRTRSVRSKISPPAKPEQSSQDPLDRMVCNEQVRLLTGGLEQLPYEQREIVMLHIHAGLSLSAIARELGISANTAKSRYRYGVKKLRHILNGEVDI